MTMRKELAALLIPVLRSTPGKGFADEQPRIEAALAAGVGGFQLIGGEQDAVRALTKSLQQKASHPLLIAADLERGAGQQFGGATGLPPLAALVTLNDLEVLRRAARLMAREARTMGVNWSLGPVCDLDLADANPVVGTRALGRDAKVVASLTAVWIEACQGEGVLACAKHFPGIGRVVQDPTLEPTVVTESADQLKEQDLQPFRAAVSAGVASMMTAHVSYPALDSSRAIATHSREMLQWLLRQQLKYNNLIVSDALSMAGACDGRSVAESAVQALRAGCDLVLDAGDVGATLEALEAALASGLLDPEQVRLSYRRRLKWAQWASPPNEWRRPSGTDTAWGSLVADRVLRIVNGPLPPLGAVTEVVVLDDDAPADTARELLPTHTALLTALRIAKHDARQVTEPTAASGGPLVVVLFADRMSGKGRTGVRASTVARLETLVAQAAALHRAVVVVACGDPRDAAPLPVAVPTICAWSGDPVMQHAAARALLAAKG